MYNNTNAPIIATINEFKSNPNIPIPNIILAKNPPTNDPAIPNITDPINPPLVGLSSIEVAIIPAISPNIIHDIMSILKYTSHTCYFIFLVRLVRSLYCFSDNLIHIIVRILKEIIKVIEYINIFCYNPL